MTRSAHIVSGSLFFILSFFLAACSNEISPLVTESTIISTDTVMPSGQTALVEEVSKSDTIELAAYDIVSSLTQALAAGGFHQTQTVQTMRLICK